MIIYDMKFAMLIVTLFFAFCSHPCRSDYASCYANAVATGTTSIAFYKWWCWRYFPAIVTWSVAESLCIQDGGKLATMYSQDYWAYFQLYVNVMATSKSPWVGLWSQNQGTPLTWMIGPNIPTDVSTVTTTQQNLLNSQYTASYTTCQNVIGYCGTSWSCCYAMNNNGGSGPSVLNAWICSTGCPPFDTAGFETNTYICEYEDCTKSSNFDYSTANAGKKFTTSITVLASSTTIANETLCAQFCVSTPFCVSFDIKITNPPKCILYATNLAESPTSLTTSTGYSHYDIRVGPLA